MIKMDMILILEDDYIADRKKYLSEGYEALHQKLGVYEACLDDIVENEKYTKSSSKAIGAKYNRYCDGFLGKIEEEGKELY